MAIGFGERFLAPLKGGKKPQNASQQQHSRKQEEKTFSNPVKAGG
jgi:hypothetical protein